MKTHHQKKDQEEKNRMVSMIHKKENTTLFAKSFASLRQFLKLHTENASAYMTTRTQVLHFIQQIRQEKTQFPMNNIPRKKKIEKLVFYLANPSQVTMYPLPSFWVLGR